MPVHVVAARLGLGDSAIALRVYGHVVNEEFSEAAAVFAELRDGVA
ncbi:hypothetical protein [Actinomadura fibrosa]|uniref:Integrase n=1 Tax=Actinomadura fibrosa TaxID=111802 RepID=A0ABW2Y3K4_9ACTN|nr:hypothetical protein [Actinomadura fibrosa]